MAVPLLALFGCADDRPTAAPVTTTTTTTIPSTTTTAPPPSTTIDEAAHPFAGPPAPDLRGTLLTGEPFVLSTSLEGLCLVIGDEDLGCDAAGPVVASDAPREQRRVALLSDATTPGDGVLAFAYLAEGAVDVVGLDREGRRMADVAFTNELLWAMPLGPGHHPLTFVFLDADGTEVGRTPLDED